MRLDEDALRSLCDDLEQRFRPLHDLIRVRKQYYHRDKAVDPVMPPHLEDVTPYQSPVLSRIGTQMVARLTENQYMTHCEPPKDTARLRENANKLEQVFEQGKSVSMERPNGDLQSGLAMGLTASAYGVIHWCMAEHVWPKVPKPEYLEPSQLPTDPQEAQNYEALYRAQGEPQSAESTFPYQTDPTGNLMFGEDGLSPVARPLSRYRETDDALQERHRYDCARAGWPWLEEVIDPTAFMFVEDRSMKNGFAIVVVVREMPLLDYLDRIRGERKSKDAHKVLSIHDADPQIPIYGERNAPGLHEPSRGAYNRIARVYQVWTRDEFYEVLGGEGGAGTSSGPFEIMKSGTHPYEMPPFAVAYGRVDWTSSDPVNRYRPALDDVYALVPQFNRLWTLYNAQAEMTALPFFYWKSTGNGEALRGTDGQIEYFTRNAANAAQAPEGYELARIDLEMSSDLLDALRMLDEAIGVATPSTGQAELEASTQPWTARLAQAQASVEPGMYLRNIASPLKVMRRNQAHVMSLKPEDGGFVQPVVAFTRKDNGKVNPQDLTYVEPQDIRSLHIDVDINGVSAQEQITLEMHGVELLGQHLITKAQFFEEYAHRENPDEQIRLLDEEEMYELYAKDGILRREAMRRGWMDIQMMPDGTYVDGFGMPLSPQEALLRNGQQPMQPPMPAGPPQGGGMPMGPNSPMPPQMGNLPGLQAPGAMALSGMEG